MRIRASAVLGQDRHQFIGETVILEVWSAGKGGIMFDRHLIP